jgi:hypothetical protein
LTPLPRLGIEGSARTPSDAAREIIMHLRRCIAGSFVIAVLVGIAYLASMAQPMAVAMTDAANKFLASLSAEQRTQCMFKFDDAERFNWHFVPLEDKKTGKSTRKGVGLVDMNDKQREAALALLKSALSEEGYKTATTIMSLESILLDLEKGKGPIRNPQWYFFTIFGTPSNTGKWGWRVEGHHLSLSFTADNGRIVSATPAFFGANPAVVQAGDRKGLRALPEIEDYARELFKSLDADQLKLAKKDKQMAEIPARGKSPKVGEPAGLPATKFTKKQDEILRKLLDGYLMRLHPSIAKVERQKLVDAGPEKIHFAYWGGTSPGQPYTYRVQGPTFLIEFLNVQADSAGNAGNHIHSAWRSMDNDFGAGK